VFGARSRNRGVRQKVLEIFAPVSIGSGIVRHVSESTNAFDNWRMTMRYTFLTYSNPADFANVPPEELGQLKGLFGAYIGALKEAGILVGVDWLQPVSAATTIRDGGNRIQDGPFAETKENLGGYMTVDVPDLDTAIAWAKKCPMAKYGAVEIRPTAMVGE
jgi:hypothetical protein